MRCCANRAGRATPRLIVLSRSEDLKLMAHQFGALVFMAALLACASGGAVAGDTGQPSGQTGSESVLVEGTPAKRAGDIPGAVTSPSVIIGGQAAVTGCTEGTPILSKSVFINGKPKVLGCQK